MSNNNQIKDLYQQVILEHNRNPKNFGELSNPTHLCEGYNPLCGDYIKLFVLECDNRITDISFTGQSCAICKASTSIMTDTVKGKSKQNFKDIFNDFHNLVTGKYFNKPLGKLGIFSNISHYPIRVKCATLGWHTLNDALNGKKHSTS